MAKFSQSDRKELKPQNIIKDIKKEYAPNQTERN